MSVLTAFTQNDSIDIKQQILNFPTPKSELISKGRNLMVDRLLANDLQRVKEVRDYLLNEVEDNYFVALYPVEVWLIGYLVGDYEHVAQSVLLLDDEFKLKFQEKIKPLRDILYQKLKENNIVMLNATISGIERSDLTAEKKDFLKMHINYLVSEDGEMQDKLNGMSDIFLNKYSDSPYENFTRQYIRYKLITSDWAFGFEFFSGASFFTENLGKRYSSSASFGVAFDIGYKNWMLYLRNHIGAGNTLIDIYDSAYNFIWLKGAQYTIFQPELSVGYLLLDSKRFRLAPFAGIASTDISPPTSQSTTNPDLKNFELPFTYTYSLGFTIDFKLKASLIPLISQSQEQGFWFIRLRYGYTMPQFSHKYPDITGNVHYVNIGIGGIASRVKRDI
jgi:hypothetical protein